MQSKAVASFWDGYNQLPSQIQRRAIKQYRLWLSDHDHPSVQFKKVGPYWSARVTNSYRAIGIKDDDTIVWFFIGSHADYDRILS